MKWNDKYPHSGDKRLVRRFALFPINIGGENRWLEFVTIEQECDWGDQDEFPIFIWHNKRFV